MSYRTPNPHRDAEHWNDDQEAASEREEAHLKTLAADFILAVQSGGDEPLTRGTVKDAVEALTEGHMALFCSLLVAASKSADQQVCDVVDQIAEAYVEHFRGVLPDAPILLECTA